MEFLIEHDDEADIVIAAMTGEADRQGIFTVLEAVLSMLETHPSAAVIMDYAGASAIKVASEDVRQIANRFGRRRDLLGSRKFANAVDGDLEYGLVRMWMSMVDERTDLTLGLFRSRSDALEWIGS